MLEVQIFNESAYTQLKPYASYASDLTRVCAFREELLPLLLDHGVEVDLQEQHAIRDVKKRPLLRIVNGNVMQLDNAPPEMLHLLGVRNEFDPTLPIRNMNMVHDLLKREAIDVHPSFSQLYGKMGYRDKISDLVCARVKFYGKGRLVDYVDGQAAITSLQFSKAVEKPIRMKTLHVRVLRWGDKPETDASGQVELGYGLHDDGRSWQAVAVQCDANMRSRDPTLPSNRVLMKFYSKSPILKAVMYPENRFAIACNRISEMRDGVLSVSDPLILPAGMRMDSMTAWSPAGRKIPADLWRHAWFEFQLRYDFDSWKHLILQEGSS